MKKVALLVAALLVPACQKSAFPAPSAEPAPAEVTPPAPVAPIAPVVAAPTAPVAPPPPAVDRRIEEGVLKRNELVGHALTRLGAEDGEAGAVVSALATVLDSKRMHAGAALTLTFEDDDLASFTFRPGPLTAFVATKEAGRWTARKDETPVEKKVAEVEVTVDSSLYESLQAAGANPELALALADVFAWDIDFYQDVQHGDTVRAVVEEFIASGKIVRYGEVLGAEYVGRTVGRKEVYRYADPTGEVSYFNADGSSARRTFLKSPLKYAHITSAYGMRLHPMLHYEQAHQGVDYGAAPGTPVWAVGDGVVTWAGMKGPNGNMVCLKHRNGLESCYCHLSAYGEGALTQGSATWAC